jgi:iron complex outermembrane receptor protein
MNPHSPVRASGNLRSGSVKARKLAMLMAAMAASSQLVPTPVIAQTAAPAATTATGTIQGRVLNAVNGMYLSNARVTVKDTSMEAFTNDFGEYEIRNVPVGTVEVVVSYTGRDPVSGSVVVEEGKSAIRNLSVAGETGSIDTSGETLTLNEFVVQSQRYRNARDIAINEERNAVNIKNVVAADSMGHIMDGNIGEFVRFLPGVDVEYGGTFVNDNDASAISVRGFGPEDTAIMIDGMPVSSPSPASLTRAVGLDMLSLNNASRVEVIKVATPDMANDSPGGSINLITRSAFEYAKPTIDVSLIATMNTMEPDIFKKSPGPANKKTYHTLPGGNFSFAMPVTKDFGFSVSLSSNNKFSPSEVYQPRWRTATQTINLVPIGGVNNTPIANANGPVNYGNPYLDRASITDKPSNTFKQSGNIKLDWRPVSGLTLSSNIQYSRYDSVNSERRTQFQVGAAQDWGDTFMRGYQYVLAVNNPSNQLFNPNHSVGMTVTTRDKEGDTLSANIKATYVKGPWSIDGYAFRSKSNGAFEDVKNGHFSGLDANMQAGRVDFYGIQESAPSEIKVWDRSANPVDYSKVSAWLVSSTIDAQSGEAYQKDIKDEFALNVRRELDFMPIYTALKVGVSRRVNDTSKWGRGTGYRMRYVGPALTSAQLLDTEYLSEPMYGLTAPQEWIDTYKLYSIYQENPALFNPDADVSLSIGNYNSATTQTKSVKEIADAGYVMLETKMLDNRLSVVAGVRQKRNSIEGRQPFVDSKFNYVQLPNGLLYTDSIYTQGVKFDGSTGPISPSGTYVRTAVITDTALRARMQAAGVVDIPSQLALAPDGTSNGTAANNLSLAQKRLRTRDLDLERTDPETPSVQAAYRITNDLQFKLAWSRETKLQNLEAGTSASGASFGNTGGILTGGSSLTINENTVPTGLPGGEGNITISNPNLQPEITNSWNAELTYYSKTGGKISVSYFYKTIKNLWEDEQVFNTSPQYAAILQSFGLNPNDYQDFTLTSVINGAAEAKRTGIEAEITQNLGIIGGWARGFDVFATYSHRPNAASTTPTNAPRGYMNKIPTRDNYSFGVAYSAQRFSIQARGTYKEGGITRGGTIAFARPGEPAYNYQIYNVFQGETRLNIEGSYKISKRYSVFLQGSNVLNSHGYSKVYDKYTGVMPDYAHYASKRHFGVTIVGGVTASF